MRLARLLAPPAVLLLFSAALSLSLGPAGLINPLNLIAGAGGVERGIIEYRLYRTLAASLAGFVLGLTGAAMQQALRNPLVDPYIVGLSSGASLGAAAAVALGVLAPPVIHAAAFAGGLTGFSLVLASAALAGLTGYSLIVVGVAYSYLLSSITVILLMLAPERAAPTIFWLMGSAAYVDRGLLAAAAPPALLGTLWTVLQSKRLEALSLGEEYAEGLGVNVRSVRLQTTIASTLAVAPIVAAMGPIGFIGLTAPWAARLLGASRFQEVMASAALYGSAITLASDVAARTLLSPLEIPLTAVTSLAGAPLLVYLSVARRWR